MIYTSYFDYYKTLSLVDPNFIFISIAGKTPNYLCNKLLKYTKLAPKYDWWNVWHLRYLENLESNESQQYYIDKYYETVLDKLNPYKVKSELLELSNRRNIVLMCYETPDKFCHRHIVSDWFRKSGIKCEEYLNLMLIDKLFK